ncbi:alpha-L-rhamnosidase C-terminal domain-containing protein [Haloferula chungangensis]|uniref:alpha-L-rhamnosidase n=1 Tax=Haloferula chungangensis TaxID=1048331 RepID=A0ABW2KZX8_9BACT
MAHFRPVSALLAALFIAASSALPAAPTKLVDQPPVKISEPDNKTILIDFGKVAFGNLRLSCPSDNTGPITFHFGEAQKNGRVDRKPPGTVRYARTKASLEPGQATIVAPPADKRNTKKTNDAHPPAILTPDEWGVILPFRWVEIEGWPGELKPEQIVRQAAFSANWDDDAAAFECSDETLNRIWELCRYSIKATTFAGVYVDGDRERIPYEADSYLNQLSHYYTDRDIQMARDTYDRLINFATWPTEWAPHMIFIAHADWMRTGDKDWIAPRYNRLKTKTLLERAAPDGLIASNAQQIKRTDIVDWPTTERDGYVFTERNTVVNAFHLAAIQRMAELARAIGKEDEAKDFEARFKKTHAEFQKQLFDSKRGIYRDGVGTRHASHHANFFPLAFGLVPADKQPGVLEFLRGKEMDCSVYAAQYLLEGLFNHGAADKALSLITADNDRSWKHMVDSGTTITWEAWDQKYKPNQDWNHAWGAAPANLLPRFVLGAEALEPGWKTVSIRPHTGSLQFARGKVPSPRGPVLIDWTNDRTFSLTVELPEGMSAQIDVPAAKATASVFVNGKATAAERKGERWILDEKLSGAFKIEVK